MTSHSSHYRINEVAELLGLTQRTIYSLLQSGKLKSRKFGGARRIGADQLEEYLKVTECHDQSAHPTSQSMGTSSISLTTMASGQENSAPERRIMKLPSMPLRNS
jgi:excisionase family DNA binding protein